MELYKHTAADEKHEHTCLYNTLMCTIHKESESESKMVPVFKQMKMLYNILVFAVCDTEKHSETFSQTKHVLCSIFKCNNN